MISKYPPLKSPTVADVIALLATLPPETPFRLVDADTNWTISVIHIDVDEEAAWFSGMYEEMS